MFKILRRLLPGAQNARDASMRRTDTNASAEASAAQTADDHAARKAGNPADEGGES